MKKNYKTILEFGIILLLLLSALGPICNAEQREEDNGHHPLASLEYEPKSHHFPNKFEGETDETVFEIWRGGGCCALNYELIWDCIWVDVYPTSGTSHGEHDPITVSIDTAGLELGLHVCEIEIHSNCGNGIFTAKVNIVDSQEPILVFNPESYDFGNVEQGENAETVFEIWNNGHDPLEYTLTEDINWIDVSPSTGITYGEHDPINVTVHTASLELGIHEGEIVIESNGGNGVFTVIVNVVEGHGQIDILIKGGLFGVTVLIRNIGDTVQNSVDYNVTVKGGIFGRIDKKTTGVIPILQPGMMWPIKVPVFGFGGIDITVIAGGTEERENGFVFLFLTFVR